MTESARFWDRIAKRYAKSAVADDESYQRKLQVTRAYLRPDMEVLEIGCGTGSTAIAHAPFVRHIRATDISSRMIEIARAKAAEQGVGNVTFEQSGLGALTARDQSHDAVLALSLLHLIDDRDAAIARIHRLLRPGGVFVSSTACIASMKLLKHLLPIGRTLGLLPMVRVFTRAQLVKSITGGGFVIDHEWQPGKGKAVFVVAKRAD